MQFIEKQIFLRRSAKLPQELRIDGSPIKSDWLALLENADVLDQRVRDADWHFFRLTEEVRGLGACDEQRVGLRGRSPQSAQTNRSLAEWS